MACSTPVLRIARAVGVCLLMFGSMLVSRAFTEVDRPFALVDSGGSLNIVNTGQVSPWDMQSLDPSSLLGGLGAATLPSYKSTGYKYTGDMLSFCGRTFIRLTNPKGAPKVIEVTGPFNSPFAVTINQYPDPKFPGKMFEDIFPRTYRLVGEEPQLLHTVLEKLAVESDSPIAVIGWAEMPEADGVALKKAPLGNKPLTAEAKDEYLESIRAQNASVIFFAVVAPRLALPPIDNTLLAAEAFDFNPDQGQPASALIHVHGALVEDAVPNTPVMTSPLLLKSMKTAKVKDIFHVYGTSTVKTGAFMIYRLRYK